MKKIILLLFIVAAIHSFAQTVTDYDGNVYQTVIIGSQVWTKENLISKHYADGSLIPNNCWYNNDLSTNPIYGKLYRWDAAMKNSHIQMAQGVCPNGWHLPSDAEWIQMFNAVSDSNTCSIALKDTNSLYWSQPLIADNSTGFSIVGAGSGANCSFFDLMGGFAEFWTSTEIDSADAKNWSTDNQGNAMYRHYNQEKDNNFSIRCVNNSPAGINQMNLQNEFSIYPNPSKGIIHLRFKNSTSTKAISISNSLGQIIETSLTKESEATFNLSNYPRGIYFIKIAQGDKISTQKMVLM